MMKLNKMQLVVLSNMERINTLLIRKELLQSDDRLMELNKVSIRKDEVFVGKL